MLIGKDEVPLAFLMEFFSQIYQLQCGAIFCEIFFFLQNFSKLFLQYFKKIVEVFKKHLLSNFKPT